MGALAIAGGRRRGGGFYIHTIYRLFEMGFGLEIWKREWNCKKICNSKKQNDINFSLPVTS